MQHTNIDDISNYQITKLQQAHILMRNKLSRKLFRYVQSNISDRQVGISFSNIIQPIQIQTGLLYQIKFMNLASQIQNYSKEQQKCIYSQNQIINTIQPIINTLQEIHAKGLIHGAITPDNIIIDQDGYLKIYYPGIKQSVMLYYSQKPCLPQDDFRALGLIVFQLLGYENLGTQDQLKILRQILRKQKYSQCFVFSLYCMIFKKSKFLSKSLSFLLQNQDSQIKNIEKVSLQARQIYDNEIQQKNKKTQVIKRKVQKAQFTPPLHKHNEHMTPKKTPQISKKFIKIEDLQNKKIFQQSKKKKPFDTVLKKVSNCKLETQNNANTPTPNYKKILRDIRQTKQRQDLFKFTTTTVKRMRTISKKKIN